MLLKQKRRRMGAQGAFHTENRFVEIRRQIKEQDRKLLEMGIEIQKIKKTKVVYKVKLFGDLKVISKEEIPLYEECNIKIIVSYERD